jgi:molecular chaperone DnaK (HSP70)
LGIAKAEPKFLKKYFGIVSFVTCPSMNTVIGIDLGTTFSTVAYVSDVGPLVIANDRGHAAVPSIASLSPTQEWLYGDAALAKASTYPESTIYDTKRMLGCNFNVDEIQHHLRTWPFQVECGSAGQIVIKVKAGATIKSFSPVDIHTMILQHMKDIAQKRFSTPVKEAVIAVPAYFNTLQRDDTEEAARRAGLRILKLIDEPSAAAIAFGYHARRPRLCNVLIYDCGGGTLDVSLLEVSGDQFHVIAKASDPHLGGRDFDDRLIEYAVDRFKQIHGVDVRNNKRAKAKLRKAAEEVKIALTGNQNAEIAAECLDGENDFEEPINRTQFENLCSDLWDRCLKPVENALRDGHKCKTDIDDIILVGGSSRIPKIHEILRTFFGKAPYEGVDPQEAVARGAAILAAKIKATGKNDPGVLGFYDICPVSLGISVNGGAMDKLIMKSSSVPVSVTKKYTVGYTDQISLCLDVYAGERGLVRYCHKVATFTLSGIPPAEGGTHSAEVTFTLTDEGKLDAKARLVGNSAVSNSLKIERNLNPYSASELRAMISAAADYREEDAKEADEAARTFELRLLDENLNTFYDNEGKGFLFKSMVSEQTKQSLKALVNERYLRSQVSALSWQEVRNTKERVREGLRQFFMKERGRLPPWLA